AIDAVIDVANLIQSIMKIISMGKNVSNQVSQIGHQYTIILNQLKQLERLGGNCAAYNNLLKAIGVDLKVLTGSSLDEIGYSSNIDSKWKEFFPDDYSQLTMDEWDTYISKWDTLLKGVAQNAATAQKSMARVQENTLRAQEVLTKSTAAGGEVAQMQALNQQVALSNAALNDLMTVSATTGRVLASGAAREAAEREVGRTASANLMQNYTDKGAAPDMSFNPYFKH
ncbi:MAG: hypothetical protein KAR13_22415, partial [Desulfobulbaceae bacterium]|nr:hypothetical protein [Desulfobulbaceae bacterium]